MDIEFDNIINEMTDYLINEPIIKLGDGIASVTKRIKSCVLPDGKIMEVQITVTTDKHQFFLDKED